MGQPYGRRRRTGTIVSVTEYPRALSGGVPGRKYSVRWDGQKTVTHWGADCLVPVSNRTVSPTEAVQLGHVLPGART